MLRFTIAGLLLGWGAACSDTCAKGYGRGSDGNCHPLADTGESDADADTDTDTDTDTSLPPPDTGPVYTYEVSGRLSSSSIPSGATVVVEMWPPGMLDSAGWPDYASFSGLEVATVTWPGGSGTSWSGTMELTVDCDDGDFFAFYDSNDDGNVYGDVEGRYGSPTPVTLCEADSPFTGIDITLR